MLKQLKEIEKNILAFFDEARKEIPALHHMDFEVTKYDTSPIPRVHGFIHIGKECKIYNNITEIYDLIAEVKARRAKNEILFQSFKGIL